ncbi:MAG: ABC transporter ATP-binding protein, partial [Caldimicrobium sp.]|nr:ABC transporter ATP-binding protein [Caldimicrobium sp.]
MKSFLKLEGVCKGYKEDNYVIRDISFEVEEGEFFSILGPSGSGKTTLLRIIAGLDSLDKGEILIGGKLVAKDSWQIPPEKRGIGLVFQDPALFPHLNVFENIAFGIEGLSKQERKRRVFELLELIGLSGYEGRYPHELSGGEKQRVALARALAPRPKVLLLDEPFANLDYELKRELGEETRSIAKKQNITVLMVTHDQEEALCLSDRIGILSPRGCLEQVGTPEEVYFTPKNLYVAGFLGRANFIKGKVSEGRLHTSLGVFSTNGNNPIEREPVLMIRPETVEFVPDSQGDCQIEKANFLGSLISYTI